MNVVLPASSSPKERMFVGKEPSMEPVQMVLSPRQISWLFQSPVSMSSVSSNNLLKKKKLSCCAVVQTWNKTTCKVAQFRTNEPIRWALKFFGYILCVQLCMPTWWACSLISRFKDVTATLKPNYFLKVAWHICKTLWRSWKDNCLKIKFHSSSNCSYTLQFIAARSQPDVHPSVPECGFFFFSRDHNFHVLELVPEGGDPHLHARASSRATPPPFLLCSGTYLP